MFRRITALLMLVVIVATNVEVGFGLARDGEVHHESEALAVVHSQARVGPIVGHGHEDARDPSRPPPVQAVPATVANPPHPGAPDDPSEVHDDHEDHEDHEHGTCLDHCTHVHAPAFPGHVRTPAPARLVSVRPFSTADLPYENSYDPLFHPPRA